MDSVRLEKNNRLVRVLKLVFIGVTSVFLISGILRAAFAPKDVNYYENRTADTIGEFSVQGYLDSSFQDSVETALADQIPLAQRAKKTFNDLKSAYQLLFLEPLTETVHNRYIRYNSMSFFNGYLTYLPLELDGYMTVMEQTVSGYNKVVKAHPEIDFYMYLVEYEALLDLETGAKAPLFEYLTTNLALPRENIGRLELNDADDYQSLFYRSDHHWNAAGSYRGYTEAMALMGCEEPLLESAETRSFIMQNGSKAKECGLTGYSETVEAYRFDYPELNAAYSAERAFFSGERSNFSYSTFYGGDDGELVFDTGRPERENLLIIGDSYDNAVLKLIASHYDRTCCVDLRNYELSAGKPFDFDGYVRENEIDKVLFLGSFILFTGEFMLES